VWTNDDLPAGRDRASRDEKSPQNYPSSPNRAGDPQTVERIRKNLEKLESQIDDINKKLKTFREFLDGEPVSTGARDMRKGINRMPVDQQIRELEEKRKQLDAERGELFDEARKKGIDPGQLR